MVSGKCAQLTEDDERGNTIQEAGHDGIGDEAQDKAQAQQSRRYLEYPNENDQRRKTRYSALEGKCCEFFTSDDRQRGSRGDVHEHRTGEDRGHRHGNDQRVNAQYGIDSREQCMRHRLRDAHDCERQAGDQVRFQVRTLGLQVSNSVAKAKSHRVTFPQASNADGSPEADSPLHFLTSGGRGPCLRLASQFTKPRTARYGTRATTMATISASSGKNQPTTVN